jgi:hypothetical protein
MSQEHHRDSQREQFWREAVAAWQKSGLSVRAFCSGRRLSEPSFYSWRRTLRRRDAAAQRRPTLVPLRVVPAAGLEVVLPTGLVLRVPAGADATAVATLVAALRAASC